MTTLTEQLAEMLANFPDTEEGKALRLRSIEEVKKSGQARDSPPARRSRSSRSLMPSARKSPPRN